MNTVIIGIIFAIVSNGTNHILSNTESGINDEITGGNHLNITIQGDNNEIIIQDNTEADKEPIEEKAIEKEKNDHEIPKLGVIIANRKE